MMHRMLWREIRAHRGVLVAIALITAIGITAFVAARSAYRNLETSRKRYYTQCRMADFWVDIKKVPVAEAERMREVPGVADLRTRIVFDAMVDVPEVSRPLSGRVLTLPDEQQPVMNDVVIRSGSYFTPARRDEVLVMEDFAEARGLRPGDSLRLILNNRGVDLLIVGVAISSEFVLVHPPGGLVPEPERYGVFWMKHSYAEEVFGFEGACNQIVGRLDPRLRNRPEVVLDEIERRLDRYGVLATTKLEDQSSNLLLVNEMQGLQTVAVFLPMLFLGVAAIVQNTLITSVVDRQRTVIGTLKALGYGNRAIFLHYTLFSLTISVVGGVLGCALGYAAAGWMTEFYRTTFFKFPDLINRVYPGVMLGGIAICVAFAVAGAYRGARRAVRLNPAEAMRPRPPRSGHRIALERWRGLWTRLDFGWQTVLRNLLRERGRTLSGVAASMAGSALIMTALYQSNAVEFLIRFQFERIMVSDYTLVLESERAGEALDEARSIPGVTYAESTFNVPCKLRHGIHHHKTGIEGIAPGSLLTVPYQSSGERVDVPPAGLLLTRKLADMLDVEAGDRVMVEPVRGWKDAHEVTVAGVIDSYLGLSVYADEAWLRGLMDEANAVNMIQLTSSNTFDERQAMYREVKHTPAVEALQSAKDTRATLRKLVFGMMKGMMVMIIVFAGLIYLGSIVNSALISLNERQREIATYRVMGYTPGQIGSIFLRESLLVNLTGALLGLGAGVLLVNGYANMFDMESFRFPRVIEPQSFIWAFVLALVFTLVAHLIVQRAIVRLDWLAALNVQE